MIADDFDLGGPLPSGGTVTVLEASAGTGKTFTIAGLVARYVADGVDLDAILAVTFSRRATAELRDGIRSRLVGSRDALRTVLAGGRTTDDVVNNVLTDGAPEQLARRAARLDVALGRLDDAPITTLHTFASRMLDELGLVADHDPGTHLEPDLEVLAAEVIADCHLATQPDHQLDWGYAQNLGRQVLAHPFEELYPTDDERVSDRIGFAQLVRAEFERRKRARQVMSYDDMIGRLATTLADPGSGPAAAQRLSERFAAVLVDEFQDTDPQQWEFLRLAFTAAGGRPGGHTAVVLIGDPKQAIYRFRGGDIETYDRARHRADQILRLTVNHRSDAGVVAGVQNLFGTANLGTEQAAIGLQPVTAHQRNPRVRRVSVPLDAQVVVRALRTEPDSSIAPVREYIQRDVLDRVNWLLSGDVELLDADRGWRPVRPDDIAILVRMNSVGADLHRLLTRADHSVVFAGEQNVFASPAADDWVTLLEALVTPDRRHVRRAMLTPLIGWTSERIAHADSADLVQLSALLSRAGRLLAEHGVAAVHETLVAELALYPRILERFDGETLLTDLGHVAELLNQAQRTEHLSPAALVQYLRRRRDLAHGSGEERARRLPADRPAIKVMTIHQAKGLQFPIVLLPQAADRRPDGTADEPVIGHQDRRRVLDVRPAAARSGRSAAYRDEELAESLRGLYVACTRAQSLLICWWAASGWNTASAPLHRLLHAEPGSTALPPEIPVGSADDLAAPPGVRIEVTQPPGRPELQQVRGRSAPAPDQPRHFADHIDRAWIRTSYTGLTAAVHGTAPGHVLAAEPETDEVELVADDPTAPAAPEAGDGAAGQSAPLVNAMASQPGGTGFGSLVHEVLEVVDPAADDLAEQLTARVGTLSARFALTGLEPAAVSEGLLQTVTTSLGRLTDDRSLRDLGAVNRLAELDFELPLGDGRRRATVAELARGFDELLDPDDPLRHYGARLLDSPAADTVLAGYLTGSVDVVLRVPGARDRYVVLDYKTNRLPTPANEQLAAHHYTPAAMTTAMCQAHYPLQALLYSVALHRYLGWRLPGYDPGVHLGGVGYLFVRGMVGAANPVLGTAGNTMPAGVFTWLPPARLIRHADSVLSGGVGR